MRFENIIDRMIADIKEGGCELRLHSLLCVLAGYKGANMYDREAEVVAIAYACGRMYEYFGEDPFAKYMGLYYTPNRDPVEGSEILSRSHIHAD